MQASAEDWSTGLQQTYGEKKLAETRRRRLTLAVAVDLSLVAVKHIAHYTCQVMAASLEASSKRCLMVSVLESVMEARAVARAAWKACLSVVDCY